MNSATPIGLFDSSSGGLSVVLAIQKLLPNESILYVGDHAHSPYGNKSSDFIRERAVKIIQYLLSQKAKMIVVACNTATVAGIEYYRSVFPNTPIVGVVPVIKTAAATSRTKNFVVLSTEFTAASEYQKNLIAQWANGCTVQNLGSTTLVPLIEEGKTESNEVREELHRIFDPIRGVPYDVVALGCTHYPFIKATIRQVVNPSAQILDSGAAIARQVERILTQNNSLSTGDSEVNFVTTGQEKVVSKIFAQLLGKEVSVSHVTI